MDSFWNMIGLWFMSFTVGVNAAACMWAAHEGEWAWASMHCGLTVFLGLLVLIDLVGEMKRKD